MKYQEGFYLEFPRSLFKDERYLSLSDQAKWLFLVLKENEHRFTSKGKHSFFRSNTDLARDCGWNVKKLERYKKEVASTGLISYKTTKEGNKKTDPDDKKSITIYKVLV